MTRINLDYAAMTPMLPEVREAMVAGLEEGGNPSSIHAGGQGAKRELELARVRVAGLLNAAPEEISFTSCGTESNTWALRGLMSAQRRNGRHLIISAVEHPSVSLAARRLGSDGARITTLPVDGDGLVRPDDLRAAMTPETVLVSIMLANGEVGTIEPIRELAAVAHEHGALFHTDAVAAAGHTAVDVRRLGVDAMSVVANQLYGPPGAAALFLRAGTRILPLLEGGGQEGGGRSGTEAMPAIVGMGIAAECARRDLPERMARMARLRDRLREGLEAALPRVRINGSWTSRLPHNLHLCIDGVSSESLVLGLDAQGINVGLGSACNFKAMRPSHVLKAIGLTDAQAGGALVLSVGVPTTEEEIARAIEFIPLVAGQMQRVTAMTSRADSRESAAR